MKKFVIIDGNNLMFRSFYALPQLKNFNGEISNAVFGFTNIILKIIEDIKPDYIAVAFDKGKKTFRHALFKDYKGNRKPTPPELISQFPIVKNLLNAMNITIFEQDLIEADDFIGALSKKFDTQNIIVTADRDCFQLINNNTSVYFPKKGVSETIIVDTNKLKELYGITPSQVVDLKSLMGDSSDNIPGVSGIGEKTALGLLDKYCTLDGIYKNIEQINGKLKEKLVNDKEMAYLSYKLATIKCDIDVNKNLEDMKYDFPFNNEVKKIFTIYQFNSLLKKQNIFIDKNDLKSDAKSIKPTIINNIDNFNEIIRDLKTNQISINLDNGLTICNQDEEYQINFELDLFNSGISVEQALNIIKPILENEKILKVVFDAKALKHKLYNYNINLKHYFDCSIARYLVNSTSKSGVNLEYVIDENLLNKKCIAYDLFLLKNLYEQQLKDLGLLDIYFNMELPLVEVLFNMEMSGFKIDKIKLNELDEKYKIELDDLIKKIYNLAGTQFNINSPKQLSNILFEKLQIKTYNNKKLSTSVDVLNDIADKHEIVGYILKYRTIAKLYNTYISVYKEITKNNDKVYTIFNQTLTTTGRLSSSEPNLQNIPVRSEEGKSIRSIFIPSFDGGSIISADYNQIELRLLASFSGDNTLIEAFNSGEDIHTRTASEVFNVPINFVTPIMRRQAKAINFGIIYGISEYGLSQNIGISVKDANNYIKKYFEKYPKVEQYMKNNVIYCKDFGFVKTYFGRIRNIPEIKSTNYNIRTFGERASMNMPLQGTASDIIKLAMIKVYNEFVKQKLKSKLILQVHDELIVDVYPNESEIVKKILKDCMENVVDLDVKLNVNIEEGKNWLEAK